MKNQSEKSQCIVVIRSSKGIDFNSFNYSNSFNYYNKQYFPNSAVLYLKWIKTKVKTATDMC